jgi:hypothetical protein
VGHLHYFPYILVEVGKSKDKSKCRFLASLGMTEHWENEHIFISLVAKNAMNEAQWIEIFESHMPTTGMC